MILHFLRHAHAEPLLADNHHLDCERVLTRSGRETMRSAAQSFFKMGLKFEGILSSPYLRAVESAKIISDVFDFEKEIILSDNLVPDALFHKFRKEMLASWAQFKSVLIVTHQPFVSECISCLLTRKDAPIALDMGTGTLCTLEIDATFKGPAILSSMIRAEDAAWMGALHSKKG